MLSKLNRKALLICLVLLAYLKVEAQFYTGSNQQFGKNRIQFREFGWQYYKFERFRIYYYFGGEKLAEFAAKNLDNEINEVEKFFDFLIDEPLEIIIYNTQSEFKQSNFNSTEDEYNVGGQIKTIGNRLYVFFEGDYASFREQLRHGVAEVIFNKFMYGGNFVQTARNSALLTLPDWYLNGLISYITEPWSFETDSRVRDAILNDRFKRFNRLSVDESRLAGHAIWKYIADTYGEQSISNILYMTKISRSVENGFLYVLGVPFKIIVQDYQEAFKKRYEMDERFRSSSVGTEFKIRTRPTRIYQQFKINKAGDKAVLVSNEMGQYKIWLYDLETKKRKRIYKAEWKIDRINDLSYPVVEWHPNDKAFAFFNERKGKLLFNTYDIEDKQLETRPIFFVEKVLSFDYSANGRTMILSGVKNGQSDLYIYRVLGGSSERITQDMFDYKEPRFLPNQKEIIFSSNRNLDSLVKNNAVAKYPTNFDLFTYDIERKPSNFTRLTNTPDVNETHPQPYENKSFTYLADKNGLVNRYVGVYDSAIASVDTIINYRYFTRSYPLSNSARNIIEYRVNEGKNFAVTTFKDGKFRFSTGEIANDQMLSQVTLANTYYKNRLVSKGDQEDKTQKKLTRTFEAEEKTRGFEVDINNYKFTDEPLSYIREKIIIEETPRKGMPKPQTTGTTAERSLADAALEDAKDGEKVATASAADFKMPPFKLYNTNFTRDFVTSQLDNSYMSEFYQPFVGPGPVNPGLGGLFKVSASDLFEDYRFIGGYRIAGNFDSNEYLISYEDLKGRTDKKLSFMRQTINESNFLPLTRTVTHFVRYDLRYPFSEVSSLTLGLIYRNDHFRFLATESFSLNLPREQRNTLGTKLVYIFDNSLPKGLNLRNGVRFKAFGEYYQEPDRQETDMFVMGFDFRGYTKIHRDIIWANRLASSTSFGSQRVVFYTGGVDNWMFFRVDESIPVDPNQNFAFQTVGTPLRGFFINARNGNSFAVLNSEIRFPVVKYFSNGPIKSAFLEHLQVIGFGDIGTAWTGPSPYSPQNAFNTNEIVRNPFTIRLNNQREPIIAGTGFGLRTQLLGYFVRADWAWGIEDGVVLPRVFHFSLNLDF
ncbi:MAG: hypothetical protein ACXITV_11565 [Luteibaculaceae bacterium]